MVAEGEVGRSLYLLAAGDAQAERLPENAGPEARPGVTPGVVLNAMPAGDFIGELAFLDGAPRAASIRATANSLVVEVPGDVLEAQDAGAHDALKVALAGAAVSRARSISDAMLGNLREQLAIKTEESRLGFILMSLTIATLAISTLLFWMVNAGFVGDVYDPGFSWQSVLVLSSAFIAAGLLLRVKPAELGLRRERLGRTLAEAIAICAVVGAAMAGLAFLTREDTVLGETVLALSPWFFLQYAVHCIVQEVGMRGLYQGLMTRFLHDDRGFKAVGLTSIVFACLHIAFGLDAVVITFFASVFLGMIYHWQKNVAGVIVIHFILGSAATLFLAF